MHTFDTKTEADIKEAMFMIEAELRSAINAFPQPFNSEHEGYAVIKEEVDELWDEVKANKAEGAKERQRKEAVQIGAMAAKYIIQIPLK